MNRHPLLIIARYSVLEAIRDKFFLFIFIGILVSFCISLFIGELTITEGIQTQVAILGSMLRVFSVFAISLFVISSIIREFNDKGFELILSQPVPRASYYFGKYAGFSVTALIIVLMILCCLCVYAPIETALFWSLSLFLELLIIIAFSLLCCFSFNSISVSFGVVMAFYCLARSMEVILLISDSPIIAASFSYKFINALLDMIAYLIPDIYRFTQTEWLVYKTDFTADALIVFSQSIIYTMLLSCAALFDLYRKEL